MNDLSKIRGNIPDDWRSKSREYWTEKDRLEYVTEKLEQICSKAGHVYDCVYDVPKAEGYTVISEDTAQSMISDVLYISEGLVKLFGGKINQPRVLSRYERYRVAGKG